MGGLPAIDAATLARMPVDDRRELFAVLDAREALAARDDFALYCARTMPGFLATPAHLELCAKAQAVADGDIRNLAAAWPVRHGKTMLLGRRFVLWWMARNPGRDAMYVTHTSELANKTGRALRSLAMSSEHRAIFPEAELASDSSRQDEWELKTGGSFTAAGVGSAIVGRGWNLGVCDDLLRGLEAANSALQREAVWDWYTSDFLSRMQNPNSQIFTSARWHDADPFARIEEQAAEGLADWHIYMRPALGPDDAALAPELIPQEQLLELRRATPGRIWQALWQGSPVADSGDVYRREWFLPSERRWSPEDAQAGRLRVYAASDIATRDGAGDWTVHLLFGVDPDGLIHVIDVWREQATSAAWISAMLDIAATWRPLGWCFGAGALFRMAEPMIRQEMQRRAVYVALVSRPETTDKVARSQTFAALMENRRVRWDTGAGWYPQALEELTRFPAGRTDDVADACSLAGLLVNSLAPGAEPAPPPPPHPVAIIGDYEPPEGMRAMTWAELTEQTMKRRRRMRARLH